ncbi:MAG: dimethyl sulfoxide reductase anchor subunit [Planctomycetes bacterium]|nr:dimethyl sulfoxide reductase anchor subunit [Planctomycetota bacterium]
MLLREQQEMTPLERFSRQHDADELPAQQRYYHDLIPLSAPAPGEQYAFDVDLDACSGCKACVSACHNLNGLDDQETWRDVGLLQGGTAELPILQHVTTACHHCIEPACMLGCPVKAYEKDPVTGIVRHLDDQCIGCQYCVLACPYDVPKYNKSLGIVRKCDMCSQRLKVGEAPACVQACPHRAIRITVVKQAEVVANCETNQFLPGAPDPALTLPTTNFRSSRPLPRNLLPADYYAVHPEHAHWPLIVMLVLTQLSVGAFATQVLAERFSSRALHGADPAAAFCALAFAVIALGASVLHLGRPLYAFRAVLGLRTSWLSREIVVFGLFAALAVAYAALEYFCGASELYLKWRASIGAAVATSGIAGVFCSLMIYYRTGRASWNAVATGGRFVLTTIVMGLSTTLLTETIIQQLSASATESSRQLRLDEMLRLLLLTAGVKLLFEASALIHLRRRQHTPLKRTARLMVGDLKRAAFGRFVYGILGGVLLPLWLLGQVTRDPTGALPWPAVAASFVFLLAGELLERYLFFTAVAAPKMPGGLTT